MKRSIAMSRNAGEIKPAGKLFLWLAVMLTLFVCVSVHAPVLAVDMSGTRSFSKDGVIVYPGPNAVLKSRRPVIGADYINIPGKVWYEPTLIVDGQDVTQYCDINRGYIFYKPPVALLQGEHDVELLLSANAETPKPYAKWSFSVGWTPPLRYVYPPAQTITDNTAPAIGVNFNEMPESVNPETVKLIVDGRDVTGNSFVSEDSILYIPEKALYEGVHTAVVSAHTPTGKRLDSIVWKFKVEPPAPEGVAAQGAPQKTSPDERHKKRGIDSARLMSGTKRRDMTIARATQYVEQMSAPAETQPPPETQPAATTIVALKPEATVQKPTEEETLAKGFLMPTMGEGPDYGITQAYTTEPYTEFAYNTSYGFEKVKVNGAEDKSSQRPHDALIYKVGLRTQTSLLGEDNTSRMFSTTITMNGTSDGDDTESLTDLKVFTAKLKTDNTLTQMYDIHPRYTPYSLSGSRLLGGEYKVNMGNANMHVFGGKFKNNRGGNRIDLYGARYDNEMPAKGIKYGIQYVTNTLTRLRGGNKVFNSIAGFNAEKKQKNGTTKVEFAQSRYSGLGDDTAYKIEHNYRKKKLYVSSKYEDVGSFFRSESGYASKGLKEFNTSMQYRFNKRLTTVLGFKRRKFEEGGSRTKSIPLIVKFLPLANKPSTTLELNFKKTDYEKGNVTKDTMTYNYKLRHDLGTISTFLSYKEESKERRGVPVDEVERISNMQLKWPFVENIDAVYKLSKVYNNKYGPETKNIYGIKYELSDWSDFSISYETVNKLQPSLDRESRKLRYSMVNPETNSEILVEIKQNLFLDYTENYSLFKYSIFY